MPGPGGRCVKGAGLGTQCRVYGFGCRVRALQVRCNGEWLRAGGGALVVDETVVHAGHGRYSLTEWAVYW